MKHIEQQTNLIIIKDGTVNELAVLHIAGPVNAHKHCNASHSNRTGDKIFWHDGSTYHHVKVSGTVIQWQTLYWDYAKPLGQRATQVTESAMFRNTLKQAHEAKK